MSALSSGGVRSSATRMAFMMVATHSDSASRISLSSIVTVRGTPSIRLRPLISIVSGLSRGYAEPIAILICSAVRSPISRLYLRFRILHDGVVHLVAGDAHRARVDDAGQRNHRHVRGAAADIHHHVARGLGDRQAGADRRHHGLLHQVNFARLGAICGVDHGALFHLRDLAGHADDDSRVHQHLAPVRLLNEVVQHALGDFEVGDDAVFHRA